MCDTGNMDILYRKIVPVVMTRLITNYCVSGGRGNL